MKGEVTNKRLLGDKKEHKRKFQLQDSSAYK